MAKRVMHELNLKRIAAVDRPCQEGATAAIMKRAPLDGVYLAKAKDEPALAPELADYLKRAPDAAAKAAGVCLPDGTFPIESRSDLRKALAVLNRAPNIAKACAHIITKARAIDANSILPASLKSRDLELLAKMGNGDAMEGFADVIEVFIGEMGAVDFDTVMAETEAREYANALLCEIDEAVCSLREVFWEINDDAGVTDKPQALQESLTQFKAHIQGIIPEGLENAIVKAALEEAGFEITEGGALTKRETDMGATIEMKKALGLPVTATDADVQKAIDANAIAAKRADAVLKMSGKHSAFMANDKAKMPAGGKEAFADMSADERDKHMEKNPIAKSAEETKAEEDEKKAKEAKKAADDLIAKGAEESLTVDGTTVLKSVVGAGPFAIMKSQQAAIEKAADAAAVTVIAKRATVDMPLISKSADDLGTLLHAIAKHSPEMSTQVETLLKATNAQLAKGGAAIFKEAGSALPGVGGTASAQIESLAQAEVTKGAQKSIFKARDFVRKTNPELAKQEESERKQANAA
jgi:hypothetical protein